MRTLLILFALVNTSWAQELDYGESFKQTASWHDLKLEPQEKMVERTSKSEGNEGLLIRSVVVDIRSSDFKDSKMPNVLDCTVYSTLSNWICIQTCAYDKDGKLITWMPGARGFRLGGFIAGGTKLAKYDYLRLTFDFIKIELPERFDHLVAGEFNADWKNNAKEYFRVEATAAYLTPEWKNFQEFLDEIEKIEGTNRTTGEKQTAWCGANGSPPFEVRFWNEVYDENIAKQVEAIAKSYGLWEHIEIIDDRKYNTE